MKPFITDERTGLQYELIGDYYFIAGEEGPEEIPIGIWWCGSPAATSAEGRSTDRAGRRDQKRNNIHNRAKKIVNNDLIYN